MSIEKICGIYKIENLINGKCYIGQSKQVCKRWKQHIKSLNENKHHSWKLQQAWKKYGIDSFKFDVIMQCKEEDLNYYEQYYMNEYDSILNGYNMIGVEEGKYNTTTKKQKEKLNKERTQKANVFCNEILDKVLSILDQNKISDDRVITRVRNGSYNKYAFNSIYRSLELFVNNSNLIDDICNIDNWWISQYHYGCYTSGLNIQYIDGSYISFDDCGKNRLIIRKSKNKTTTYLYDSQIND